MKHYGKLTATAAAGFMALSVLNVAPVFANEEGTNGDEPIQTQVNNKQATITVNVRKGKGINNPVGTPRFTISGTDVSDKTPSNNAQAIYPGDANDLRIDMDAFDHSVTDGIQATTTGTISIVEDRFTNKTPGQYVYTVTLSDITTGEGASTTDGISVGENQVYTINVYKDNDGNLLMTVGSDDNEAAAKSGSLNFTADDNTYTTYTLTVTKKITGNQSVSTTKFPFTVNITPSDTGESHYVVSKC